MPTQHRTDKLHFYTDHEGQHRWRYKGANGAKLADSGQGYATRRRAILGASRLCNVPPGAITYNPNTHEVSGFVPAAERHSGYDLEIHS